METLTIINTISNLAIILILIALPISKRLEFTIERTFWEKRPFGFNVVLWKQPIKSAGSNSGKTIIKLNWRNEEKMRDDVNRAKSKKKKGRM